MQENNEIMLNEIFAAIFRKWKTVVAFALIFALLLGGFKFAKLYKQAKAMPIITDAANDIVKSDDNNYFVNDKATFDNILKDNYEKYQQLSKYITDSYYYNLDYTNCAKTTIDIHVIAEDKDIANQVAIAIADRIKNMDAIDFAKNTDIDSIESQYIRELVSCGTNVGDWNGGLPIVSISATAADTKTSGIIVDNIWEQVEEYINSQKKIFGEFQVYCFDAGEGYFVDIDLMNHQNDIKNCVANAVYTVDNAKNNIDSHEFNSIENELIDSNDDGNIITISILKSAVKMAIIGFIGGAFIGCCFVFLQVVFKPTVYSSRLLSNKNIKFIGNAENTAYKGMNKLANIIAGDKEFCTDRQNRLSYIANCLNDIAKDKKIMVTGTVESDVAEGFVAEIKNIAPDCNIIYSGNLSTEPKAVSLLNECDGIVLLEKKNVSLAKDVYRLILRAKSFDKPLEGYVVL